MDLPPTEEFIKAEKIALEREKVEIEGLDLEIQKLDGEVHWKFDKIIKWIREYKKQGGIKLLGSGYDDKFVNAMLYPMEEKLEAKIKGHSSARETWHIEFRKTLANIPRWKKDLDPLEVDFFRCLATGKRGLEKTYTCTSGFTYYDGRGNKYSEIPKGIKEIHPKCFRNPEQCTLEQKRNTKTILSVANKALDMFPKSLTEQMMKMKLGEEK